MDDRQSLFPFTWHYEDSRWAVMSNVDHYCALGESLGEALLLACEASALGFTEARPSPTDVALATVTWNPATFELAA
jgi:hypothetical protein